ncbi:MAG: enoyl-CoA hydratase/isomerase family protein [Vulcanimicrobiaceae bacterium]
MSVSLERRGAIGWLRIAKPQTRNAMSASMWRELGACVADVARDASLRALVVGGGADAFVSGADIGDFRTFSAAPDGLVYEHVVETALAALEALDVATIAAIAGACTGGGAILAAACDIRIGATSARVGVPIAKNVGNLTTAANVARLAEVVGEARVVRWLLTAELSSADEALAFGFFSEVLDDFDALETRAHDLADRIGRNAPLTIAGAKELVRRLRVDGRGAADSDLLARCYGSHDFHEGVSAFVEKRPARFVGR